MTCSRADAIAFEIQGQAVLAAVRQWEIGDEHPGSPSLELLDRKGLELPV